MEKNEIKVTIQCNIDYDNDNNNYAKIKNEIDKINIKEATTEDKKKFAFPKAFFIISYNNYLTLTYDEIGLNLI